MSEPCIPKLALHLLRKNAGTFLILLIFISFSCEENKTSQEIVIPDHFKIQEPFEILNGKIIVATLWGKFNVHQYLIFDNHAPSTGDSYALGNSSISKIKDVTYSIFTVDSAKMKGDVFVCDTLKFGKVKFTNSILYLMERPNSNAWNG